MMPVYRPPKPKLKYYTEYDEFLRAWCVKDTEGKTWMSNAPKDMAESTAAKYNRGDDTAGKDIKGER